ncbi:OsmC family protein [uncultured Lutibacter sp.]|uniref:OsmC family protein n=1 Tax=uncultured Lutibacter sp. TaxID=437739 RepID=UPI00260341CB|nr:OsmC family protein [uncultured Lutibacter sp.]
MSDLKFRIKAKSENATKTVVKTRGFEIIVDEPKALGGGDAGANPVEYVLAALSGCLNIVGHMIANELNIELRGIEISMSGNLNPNCLFGTSMEERAGYKNIEVIMKPDCDASPEILSKWLKLVEDRCPVSDNIGNATPINFKLKKTHQIAELN